MEGTTLVILLGALVLILIGAETFTNALEHLGERLKISEGVTGSIFAAVGTALPETMVPVVAILSTAGTQQAREEVGGGAIPIFVPHQSTWVRAMIAISLVLVYFIYLMLTIRASAKLVADGHGTAASEPLFLVRLFGRIGMPENMFTILLQLAIGLTLIVFGAHGFVQGVEQLSVWLGLSALVLALLIVPVATELPEKVNSIIWIRRRKDTLAFGNITGAMVFQGSLLPALGILLTPWEPREEVLAGVILTLVASSYLMFMTRRGHLRPVHLFFNGFCYLSYLIFVLV